MIYKIIVFILIGVGIGSTSTYFILNKDLEKKLKAANEVSSAIINDCQSKLSICQSQVIIDNSKNKIKNGKQDKKEFKLIK